MASELVEAAEKCGGSILAWDNDHARYLKNEGAKSVIVAFERDYVPRSKAKPVILDSFAAVRLLGDALDAIKEANKSPWRKTKEEPPQIDAVVLGKWDDVHTLEETQPCIYRGKGRWASNYDWIDDLVAPSFWMYIPTPPEK